MGSFEDYLKLRRCPVDHPLYTINGELAVDKVGKYENLEADWREILSQIGLPVKDLSERLNTWQRSSSEPYLQYYNEYTRKVVADLYAREINLFGYQFGD